MDNCHEWLHKIEQFNLFEFWHFLNKTAAKQPKAFC